MIVRVLIKAAKSGSGSTGLGVENISLRLTNENVLIYQLTYLEVIISLTRFLLQKQVKGAVTIAVTVGVPWIVGLMTFEPMALIGQWLFIILTGLQVFINLPGQCH